MDNWTANYCTFAYIYRLFLLCIFLQLGSILSNSIALLVIDVQNCFLPGGSLAVTEGDHVIPVINEIRSKFDSSFSLVVLSQDWHCSDHISFASQHANTNPFQDIQLLYDSTGICINIMLIFNHFNYSIMGNTQLMITLRSLPTNDPWVNSQRNHWFVEKGHL